MMLLKFGACILTNIASRKTIYAKILQLPLLSSPVRSLKTTDRVYFEAKKSQTFCGLNPFGKIIINHASRRVVNYKIMCLNPQDNPDQDKVCMTASDEGVISCRLENNVLSVNDIESEDRVKTSSICCQIEVPVKFDIYAELSGASSISISNLENEIVTVKSEKGRCLLRNIQTRQFNISSNDGDIVSEKLLQGNGVIATHSGIVSIHKILSQIFSVQSQTGDVNITNLYANSSNILTAKGSVHIVNSHMDTDVAITEQGNIKIDSVSGSLNADVHKGDVNVMISEPGRISLSAGQGDIIINIPRTLSTTLKIKGNSIENDRDILLKDVVERQGDELKLLQAFVEGLPRPDTITGSITANSNNGKIKLLSSDDGWLSMIQANLKKK